MIIIIDQPVLRFAKLPSTKNSNEFQPIPKHIDPIQPKPKMTDLEKLTEVKCDGNSKVQLYNFNSHFGDSPNSNSNANSNANSNHRATNGHPYPKNAMRNGVRKLPRRINRLPNRNAGLTVNERKSINIDSICHLNWMIIILLFTLINLYERNLDERCVAHKSTLITFSRLISSVTAIETTVFYLTWFFLTNSRHYHIQTLYDTITGTHIFIAFINILYAVCTFLSRTCHESKLTAGLDLKHVDKLHLVAYKYDLKIAGAGHIFLTTIIVFSAIHLTTKRSKFTLHYLAKRGLLTEYFWATID